MKSLVPTVPATHAFGVDDAPPISLPFAVLFLVWVDSSKRKWVTSAKYRRSDWMHLKGSHLPACILILGSGAKLAAHERT
jgi:hypothetical protein